MIEKTVVFPKVKVGNRTGTREWQFTNQGRVVVLATTPLQGLPGYVKYRNQRYDLMNPREIEHMLEESPEGNFSLILIKAVVSNIVLGEIAILAMAGVLRKGEGAVLVPQLPPAPPPSLIPPRDRRPVSDKWRW